MSWVILLGLALALSLAFLATRSRREELSRMRRGLQEREQAVRQEGGQALLRHPVVDLSRCLGCGTCVAACPEEGVLELVHGQALVVNGARCVGHAACERECPVGAITVTLANLEERRDVPVLTASLEAVGSSDLFLAGELTAHALIKVAIEQGTAVAAEVGRRCAEAPAREGELDLVVVGAGPAGLACALEARALGLSFLVLEQEQEIGGTVAKYPRRKLVLTQPVELPLHGPLARTSYTKEELVSLWRGIAREHELPVRCGEVLHGVERRADGGFLLHATSGTWSARHVCLALGRRGTPRKLGVPGEELPKVAYSLLDARSYRQRRVLVVGGGDSAVEVALGLAEQPGNEVTLSYRREAFFRIRRRNEERLARALEQRALRVLLASEVRAIHEDDVELELREAGGAREVRLPNDEVFVMAGGVAPLELLGRCGVSCDPALRAPGAPLVEQGTGLARALAAALAFALVTFLWAVWHADYYLLPREARPAHEKHLWLQPGSGLGLAFGLVATGLIAVNFLYLLRRSPRFDLRLFSLRAWMTSHVATGLMALCVATLHGAMDPRNTAGGHGLLALALLAATGAVGRYFYARVPRAANGRELELEEVKLELERLAERWDTHERGWMERVRAELEELLQARQWRSSFLGRVRGLVSGQWDFERLIARLSGEGRAAGISEERLRETVRLARDAHRHALAAAHFEDVRGLLSSWRYLHRWIGAALVLLLVLHVIRALAYGSSLSGGTP